MLDLIQVKNILREIDSDVITDEIKLESNLSDVGIDSLTKMDLVYRLEEKTGISLSDDQVDKIYSVQDLIIRFK